jgi:hypothetical protein
MSLRFSDGMSFDTSGPPRMVRKSDGLYVVGNGMMIPVNSEAEATATIKDMTKEKSNGPR